MNIKKKLEKSISAFPNKFSIEGEIEQFIIFKKIKFGNQQSLNCEIVSDENLEVKMTKLFE